VRHAVRLLIGAALMAWAYFLFAHTQATAIVTLILMSPAIAYGIGWFFTREG
jgi:hypothetical protein